MSGFTRSEQLELVRSAARAPSVHNVQPARWRFVDGGEVQLHRALERVLPAADPSGRDVRQSLGASFEGMALALSRRGLALGAPAFASPGLELVATAHVTPGRDADPLAELVERRRAFRGRFDAAEETELAILRAHFDSVPDVRLILGPPALDELGQLYDRASYSFLSQPAYWREFHGWCRFLRSHPDYARDGLNADCLALSALERLAAWMLLRPRVFAIMCKLGLGSALVSEGAQIRSSAAVLLFSPRREIDPFDAGRRFYRVWLELTALGFHACPLSALADARSAGATLEREHGIPPEHTLLNAFRVGPVRRTPVPESARLPQHELLLD